MPNNTILRCARSKSKKKMYGGGLRSCVGDVVGRMLTACYCWFYVRISYLCRASATTSRTIGTWLGLSPGGRKGSFTFPVRIYKVPSLETCGELGT